MKPTKFVSEETRTLTSDLQNPICVELVAFQEYTF